MQTCQDAIMAMLNQSVILPPELLREVEEFIERHREKGYTRKEEFIRQAIRFYLKWESEEYECIEIPKHKYEKLKKAVKEMNMPYYNAAEFIEDQIDKALEQYEEYLKETKKNRRRLKHCAQRKKNTKSATKKMMTSFLIMWNSEMLNEFPLTAINRNEIYFQMR